VITGTGADYNAVELIAELEKEMIEAAEALEFERAALLRDQIHELKAAQKAEASKGGVVAKQAPGKRGRKPRVAAAAETTPAKSAGAQAETTVSKRIKRGRKPPAGKNK